MPGLTVALIDNAHRAGWTKNVPAMQGGWVEMHRAALFGSRLLVVRSASIRRGLRLPTSRELRADLEIHEAPQAAPDDGVSDVLAR